MASSFTKTNINRIVSSFDDAFDFLNNGGVHNSVEKRGVHKFRSLNNFILNKMNLISRTVIKSSLSETLSDSKFENDLISDDSMDLEYVGRHSEDESDVYGIDDVSENSLRIVDVEFLSIDRTQSTIHNKQQ